MAKTTMTFTPDEILAELRRRASPRAASGVGAKAATAMRSGRRSVPLRQPGAAKLAKMKSGQLVKALRRGQRAIYGVDNRVDFFKMPAGVKSLAESSVALVESGDLVKQGTGWRLQTTVFGDDYELCQQEPFWAQPLGCFCSGVLVAPDVIATAGHCVTSAARLAQMRFVFGFRMTTASKARTQFANDDVYRGIKVIGRQLTADGVDWALVQLDRPVTGRTPVAFRASGKISGSASLFVIGHPCGLPQKFADGAEVKQNANASYFSATLDTYGGNSGSPVFNTATRTLEGLLVRGATDFVRVGNCHVSKVFPTTGVAGEDVTRSTVWAAKVPKSAGRPTKGRSAKQR